jgi:ribosome-binding factor A
MLRGENMPSKSHFSSNGPSQRQLRVGEMIRRTLAELLSRGDLYDPELEKMSITVSEVRISPDLKVSSVFVLPLGGDKKKEAIESLERNKYEIRKVIAKSLKLKYVPDLRFIIDETFDQIDKTEQLLNQEKVKFDLGKSD